MKKGYNYLIGIVIGAIAIYNSVYFQPLDEKLAENTTIEFDASSFVKEIWPNLLVAYDSGTEINQLLGEISSDPQQTFTDKANALGIGNIGYFKVMGEGKVESINENNVIILVGDQRIEIETEFVFGNAVRDASGLVKVNDFDKTSDFNSISEELNHTIREEVIPGFKAKVQKDATVLFKGAVELNKEHLDLTQPEVIPVILQITP